jgi:nucleotide-binding universal stress UspA family protein
MKSRQHIVVGVSRTPPGEAALRWALGIGLAQGWEVVAVHAFDASVHSDLALERDQLEAARSSGRRAQAWVQEIAGTDDVRQLLIFRSGVGAIEDLLVEQAVGAALLVLGAPTTEPHSALPESLRLRCSCPVVVVGEGGAASVQTVDGPDDVVRNESLVGGS